MKFLMKLWLFIALFLIIGHCQEDAADAAEGAMEEGDAGDEGEVADMGGEEAADEGEDASDEGEADGEMPEEGEDEQSEEYNPEPLTSEQAHALHKKLDANGNGKVSLAEISEFAQKMRRTVAKLNLDEVMKEMDIDKDGKLTYSEFLGDPGKLKEELQNEKAMEFRDLDTNNDKFLDSDELTMLFHHHTNDKVEDVLTGVAMKDKDTDKNGMLSLQEFFGHLQEEGEDPVEITDEDKEIFSKLDMDGSGTLTLKELKAWESGSFAAESAVKKLFAAADKDKDNVVTVEELDAAREDIANDPDGDAQMYLQEWSENHHHAEL